jgi:hypothetical protein
MNGTINYNFDIKFQIALNKKNDLLYPVLLMFHDFTNKEYNNMTNMTNKRTINKRVNRINSFYPQLNANINKTILNIIDLENLNDLTKLSNLINEYYRNGKNFHFISDYTKTDANYTKI